MLIYKIFCSVCLFKNSFLKYFIYLFLERGGGSEKETEGNINMWMPLTYPQLGAWPETQACALTGNWTSNLMVHMPVLNLLSHTSRDYLFLTNCLTNILLKFSECSQYSSTLPYCFILYQDSTTCVEGLTPLLSLFINLVIHGKSTVWHVLW